VSPAWPAINYEQWSSTCDTLHAHTQTLGTLAVALDLRTHDAVVEHSHGQRRQDPLQSEPSLD
jgi:hypothetical protein